ITSSLTVLVERPELAPAVDAVEISKSPAAAISALTETFARVYLANVHDVLTAIVFIHAVTGAAAMRTLLPLLDDATARRAVGLVWQGGASLFATFGRRPFTVETIEPPRESVADLVDHAVAHRDEHAIKFTEACLREHELAPSPAYLAAARHVTGALPRPA
ncbi:MAG: questin oxidase family protein, partial [Candidatus Binatia bacterium]